MPREDIRDESGVVAQVTWSADQYVQLATLSRDTTTFIAWCRDLVERYEEALKKAEDQDPPIGSLGMFWSPSRREINELIRVLRRARNSAYGADE